MGVCSETLRDYLKKAYLGTFEEEDVPRMDLVLKTLLQTTGNTILSPLSYYLKILREFDKAQLTNMTPEEKIKCKQRLYITYLLLLQDKQYKETHEADIAYCENLLDWLEFETRGSQEKTRKMHADEEAYKNNLAVFTAIQKGHGLGQRNVEYIDGIIKVMTWVNNNRLYWIWAGGFLRTILALMPEGFYYSDNATLVAKAPFSFTGVLSWTLYFTRFTFNSLLLLNNIFVPQLTEEDNIWSKLSYSERFKKEWSKKKFELLNDLIWGIANMMCFFWFQGSDGDALTLFLLVFDIKMVLWGVEEEKTQHLADNKKEEVKESDVMFLIDHICSVSDTIEKKRQCHVELDELLVKQTRYKGDWRHKELGSYNNIVYASALLIAFALLTMPFMPLSAATLYLMNFIGSVLCFMMILITNIVKGIIEGKCARLSSEEAEALFINKIYVFEMKKRGDPALDDMEKIRLFMEINQLMTEFDCQEQMRCYQIVSLIRKVIIQSLIPAIMFGSFVFLPIGTGFAVLAATLALAIVSYSLIEDKYAEIKTAIETKFSEFDNCEYEKFYKNPGSWYHSKSRYTLFQHDRHERNNWFEDNLFNDNSSLLV